LGVGRERRGRLDIDDPVRLRDDGRGLLRADERAGRDDVEMGDQRTKALGRGLRHAECPIRRTGTANEGL